MVLKKGYVPCMRALLYVYVWDLLLAIVFSFHMHLSIAVHNGQFIINPDYSNFPLLYFPTMLVEFWLCKFIF